VREKRELNCRTSSLLSIRVAIFTKSCRRPRTARRPQATQCIGCTGRAKHLKPRTLPSGLHCHPETRRGAQGTQDSAAAINPANPGSHVPPLRSRHAGTHRGFGMTRRAMLYCHPETRSGAQGTQDSTADINPANPGSQPSPLRPPACRTSPRPRHALSPSQSPSSSSKRPAHIHGGFRHITIAAA
jgi:hypothetical protein